MVKGKESGNYWPMTSPAPRETEISKVSITHGFFPDPAAALDLGWTAQQIIKDCRRMPREDLTDDLHRRLAAAGLKPAEIRELFRHPAARIASYRSGIQRRRERLKEEIGESKDMKKITFHEGIKSGMNPREALEKCDPSAVKDLTPEIMKRCAEDNFTAKEIGQAFGIAEQTVYHKLSQAGIKLSRKNRFSQPVVEKNTEPVPETKSKPEPEVVQPAPPIPEEVWEDIGRPEDEPEAQEEPVPDLPYDAPIVYLSGAIDGVSLDDAASWRKQAIAGLAERGIKALDPLRRGHQKFLTTAAIVEGDFEDVRACDIMLIAVHIPGAAQIGTGAEMNYAAMLGKPIIVWGRENRESIFLQYYADAICDTLPEAIQLITGIVIGLKYNKGA